MFNFKKTIILLSVFFMSLFGFYNHSFAEGTIKVKVSADFHSILPNICSGTKGNYICNVPKGVNGFEIVMASLIKYITFIASLAGVLFIVVNGILYSMGGADDSLKTESKKRITQTLIGLVMLLLSGVILHIVAPWVYS